MESAQGFPQERADGTFTVAIRFALTGTDAVAAARAAVAEYPRRKLIDRDFDVLAELGGPPRAEELDADTLQVVLDCQALSTLWKGILAELVAELSLLRGLRFIGIWDVVSGHPHPASVKLAHDRAEPPAEP
jgi:hypothetical protein